MWYGFVYVNTLINSMNSSVYFKNKTQHQSLAEIMINAIKTDMHTKIITISQLIHLPIAIKPNSLRV